MWIILLKWKWETQNTFKQFKSLVENKYNEKLKEFGLMGGESLSLYYILQKNKEIMGISFTCILNFKMGGFKENNCHLIEVGLTLIAQAQILPHWSKVCVY